MKVFPASFQSLKRAVVAFCLVATACTSLRAEDGPTAALVAADDARIAAMKAPAREQLEAIFSDDLRYCHSSGSVDSKSSFIEVLTSGRTKYVKIDPVERSFTFPAPTIALMTGKAAVLVETGTGKLDAVLGYLAVWRQEGGKWRFLAWQSCKLPAPTPAPTK